eukprot:gene5038-6431_t
MPVSTARSTPLSRRSCLMLGVAAMAAAVPVRAASPTAAVTPGGVGPVPASLKLSKFYTQYADAGGVPVVASYRPLPASLLAARSIVLNMLSNRADVLAALRKARVRVAVIGAAEVTTDIPEYATLVPADWWNSRTRGVGATTTRPVSS